MDKSWIKADRDSFEYEIGVENFLIFAEENSKNPKKIPCPCARCVNFKKYSVNIIRGHLYESGFSLGYYDWIWHGEEIVKSTKSSVGSTCPPAKPTPNSETFNVCEAAYNKEDRDNESDEFKRFVADAEQPLFEGSECTKLESVLKLHNWKARFGVSDKAFTDLLESIGSFLPKDNVLPANMYEAKKTLTNLGLEYVKFHACPNDCVLYRGPILESSSECPKCRLSRWKVGKDGKTRVNVPAKVMWYFPIIPRFKRMFKSASTAKLMSWHADNRSEDGKMHHPSDSPSWRNVDYRWPEFGKEARNIRLGLAADGINPHSNGLKNRYSCWPVMLVIYNLPPWLCMKRKFIMLSTLISGPHEPGNNIDIYLQPLIDDLKKLWEEGEPNVYDAHTKSFFTLRAVLMWTVNDFPGYANLSGCINKGYKACPICGDKTVAKYLSHSKKMCYQGHRRYLDNHHPFRRQRASFDGEQEFGHAPEPLSGEEVLAQQQQLKFCFGKGGKSKKVESAWKKKSIFFELEYWKFHHVRHCLDVMHIEKNVCDNLIGTLLNMKYKTKDSIASRLDMVGMGLRADLAPEIGEKRTYLPPAPFTLSKKEKKNMLSSLSNMKLPYGHASNIRNCVSIADLNLYGLKSHDCHILLQQLLPVSIRSVLPKNVRVSIIRLCFFFNSLCNKIVDVSKLSKLQADLILTLCELEKIFPPSFFDVMVHLTVHLVRELRLCGPVFYRWMFPFERFNKILKSYVRNRFYPEGCIAEGYLKEESIEFCTEFYSESSRTAGLRKDEDNNSGPIGGVTMKSVPEKERDEAHLTVLLNNTEVEPYVMLHKKHLEGIYQGKKKSAQWLLGEHNRQFADWFEQKVSTEMRENSEAVSETIKMILQIKKKERLRPSGENRNKNDELQKLRAQFLQAKPSAKVPKGFNLLFKHATSWMQTAGVLIQVDCKSEVFGHEKTIYLLHENVLALLEFDMLGQAVITSYMAHLHAEISEEPELAETFAFIDPGSTYNLNADFEAYIVDRLKEGNPDRLFFMPHNQNMHWILAIIWEGEIYFLNPLPHPTQFILLEQALSRAVKTYNCETGRGNRKPAKAKFLSGSPKQPGGHECAYVVMRYMKEIISDRRLTFATKWLPKTRETYNEAQLDEVRIEALNFIQDQI